MNLNSLLPVILLALVVAAIAAAVAGKKGGKSNETPRKKPPLTANEQAMFNRLKGALPELNVLAQVSFGALLTAKSRPARNTFDRKIADFVVCDAAFQVLAVVELDDSSHKGRERQDASRDSLLTTAGYRVLRYPRVPDIDKVRSDFFPPVKVSEEITPTPKRGAIRLEPKM